MIGLVSGVLLTGLVGLGAWERVQRDRAHRALPIRIHVNGTRGKSTVTRMIAAALRASGIPTVAKTTGTAARLLLADGTEQTVRRRTAPSIREQLWFLRKARRLGARAVVVECMALEPGLQAVSEREMVKATVGVITNARADHGDVMGFGADAVATALAATVPTKGTLVLGPALQDRVFADAARTRGTTLCHAQRVWADARATTSLPAWTLDNLATSLGVTRALGIADDVAWPAMLAAPGDPGAVRTRTALINGRLTAIVDASAANDPESLAAVIATTPVADGRLFVFNHRADRPLRLRQFADAGIWRDTDTAVLVTGDTPDLATRRAVVRAVGRRFLGFAPVARLAPAVRTHLAGRASAVVLCGNTKHLDPDALCVALGSLEAPSMRTGTEA